MASEVDICSNALQMVGDDAIVSLTDDNDRARLCNRFYFPTRDEVLRAHPWNFAVKRQVVAPLTATPAFEFTNAFQWPPDCLRVMRLFTSTIPDFTTRVRHRIEGRTILADADSINLIYIKRETDPNQFDELFRSTLEARLASKLAWPLAEDVQMARDMFQIFKDNLDVAKTVDAQEGTPHTGEEEDIISSRTSFG